MTIEYARAYYKERLAGADSKRLMRQAAPSQRAFRGIGSVRARLGGWLIELGEQLIGVHTLSSQTFARVETSR